MTNVYITPHDFLRSTTGMETASLVGTVTRLSAPMLIGATQLSILPGLAVGLNTNDRIAIFDGANTEFVTVSSNTNALATTVQITTCQYAHSTGTALCSDGVSGSLADEIITASDMLEDICYQSLLLGTRTDVLSLQTTRASINNHGVLNMRPMSFPVQSVTSLVYNAPGSATITLDASQVFINSGAQTIQVYQLIPTQSVPFGSPFQTMLNNRSVGTVTVTYTSGFTFAAMPPRIKKACILLTTDQLSRRYNSQGAFMVMRGKTKTQYAPPTDTIGTSLLYKQAVDNLSSFTSEAM